MPMRCCDCESLEIVDADIEERFAVAGRSFAVVVPGTRCAKCGNYYLRADTVVAVERSVAAELARRGDVSPAAVRDMRKTIPLRRDDLAAMLGVTTDTIVRWESGEEPIERNAAALLSMMVLDRLEGRTNTIDHLRDRLSPEPWPDVTRLAPDPAVVAPDAAPKDLPVDIEEGHRAETTMHQDEALRRGRTKPTSRRPKDAPVQHTTAFA